MLGGKEQKGKKEEGKYGWADRLINILSVIII